jgi:hypothetical protein
MGGMRLIGMDNCRRREIEAGDFAELFTVILQVTLFQQSSAALSGVPSVTSKENSRATNSSVLS